MILTKDEKSILFGTWLGDGHIQKRNTSYRTKIHHGYKQYDYVLWKYERLKRLCTKTSIPKKTVNKKNIISYYFSLNSGSYLKEYHELFYKKKSNLNYRKSITLDLINVLPQDPLFLAVWYMDDGHIRTNAFSGKLGTYAFSKNEHFLLKDYLFDAFGINFNIVLASREKNQYYLSIPAKNNNFKKFIDLIDPFVSQVPSLVYKTKKFK